MEPAVGIAKETLRDHEDEQKDDEVVNVGENVPMNSSDLQREEKEDDSDDDDDMRDAVERLLRYCSTAEAPRDESALQHVVGGQVELNSIPEATSPSSDMYEADAADPEVGMTATAKETPREDEAALQYVVGDLVDFNSDPNSPGDNGISSHMHRGTVLNVSPSQISVQLENGKSVAHFLDDIEILPVGNESARRPTSCVPVYID